MYDRVKLGAWIQANHPAAYGPGGAIQLRAAKGEHGELLAEIVSWPEELGKPPTLEEVDAQPDPVIVDKAAELDAAMLAAKSGTAAVKATAAVDAIEALNARVAQLEKRLGL